MPHDDSAFAGTAISKPPPCSCYLHGGLCFTCGECKPPSTKTRQREERREVRRSSSCLTSLSAFVCESGVSPCKPSWLLHKHTIFWKEWQGIHCVCRRWGCLQALGDAGSYKETCHMGGKSGSLPSLFSVIFVALIFCIQLFQQCRAVLPNPLRGEINPPLKGSAFSGILNRISHNTSV